MDMSGDRWRKVGLGAAAVALVVAVVIGITQMPDSEETDGSAATEADFDRALADAPAKLAAVYEQGDALLPGGVEAAQDEVRRLRGTPVVVNAWGSWCGPCREEFPYFQEAVIEYGDRVAFLGVDTEDNEDAARDFLDDFPLPYPSYTDPDGLIRGDWRIAGLPATAFYDSSGERVYLHRSPYTSTAQLVADINRYAN
jgi:thiol-disulfide isomerase/thioredoxin